MDSGFKWFSSINGEKGDEAKSWVYTLEIA